MFRSPNLCISDLWLPEKFNANPVWLKYWTLIFFTHLLLRLNFNCILSFIRSITFLIVNLVTLIAIDFDRMQDEGEYTINIKYVHTPWRKIELSWSYLLMWHGEHEFSLRHWEKTVNIKSGNFSDLGGKFRRNNGNVLIVFPSMC